MTGMGVSYHQKNVRTCRGWGNIFFFGGVIENGGSMNPNFAESISSLVSNERKLNFEH